MFLHCVREHAQRSTVAQGLLKPKQALTGLLFQAVYVPNLVVRGFLWISGDHNVYSHSGGHQSVGITRHVPGRALAWGCGHGLCPGLLSGGGVSACYEELKGNISGPERKPEGERESSGKILLQRF